MTMRKRTRSNSRRGEEQRKTRRNCAWQNGSGTASLTNPAPSHMTKMIQYLPYMCYVCALCICAAGIPSQAPQKRTAKPNSTHGKEGKGVYKQCNQQKRATRSVYCEHGDKMD
jgi:hypothetical protein